MLYQCESIKCSRLLLCATYLDNYCLWTDFVTGLVLGHHQERTRAASARAKTNGPVREHGAALAHHIEDPLAGIKEHATMTVRRPSGGLPKTPADPDPPRLSLRWFVVVIAGAGAYLLGAAAAGPVSGVVLTCAVVGLLHAVLE
jgi:hypothetical protein